ncbi:M48 family metalloprotease [Sphingomonas sp. CGMCC 1.13654]|uniref:M48 family metalloprotease n=1 Tax=Sphingomonas chungangi TaxID=2683589 RepID=A0A838L0Z6_9SPHN|nr:M48 family metallopeptidase [Sphingomonas chungangi]MBA2933163.1 M48 family metalloprotease [Sphingomonas chungangi]MVW57835.1 M48 family metalloprotease [Sphingomonas chungangi]
MGFRKALLAGLALAATAAGPAPGDPKYVRDAQQLLKADLTVAKVAYLLQTNALGHCPRRTALPGMLVIDPSQYPGDWRRFVAAQWGADKHPTVEAVIPGGPADEAGVKARDAIVSLDGQDLGAQLPALTDKQDGGTRITMIRDRIDAAFAAGPVTLGLLRDGNPLGITVTGTPACWSFVEIGQGTGHQASAEGTVVTIDQGMLAEIQSEADLAFILGHELSHNFLKTRETLDAQGTSFGLFSVFGENGARLRDSEREADYWGVYMMTWAGYDPHDAAIFWRRHSRMDINGLFAMSHPSNATRVHDLEAVAAEIDAKKAAGKPLDPDYGHFREMVGH